MIRISNIFMGQKRVIMLDVITIFIFFIKWRSQNVNSQLSLNVSFVNAITVRIQNNCFMFWHEIVSLVNYAVPCIYKGDVVWTFRIPRWWHCKSRTEKSTSCATHTHTYIYVWKFNHTVLELDFRAVKCVFFPRRDLNPHHWYTAAPFA
jgi:hypothetical protein